MPSNRVLPRCEKEVEILYEDEDLLFVEKPAGLLSVPGRHPLNRDSVISRLQEDYPEATTAHRLDLDTSGLMVIPLHKQALRALSKQFQERLVEKMYTAVVYGIVEKEGTVDLPLRCDWPNRPRQMVCYEHGKPSLTHYEVIEPFYDENRTRIKLMPVTGRSHQLRVHMSKIGHPILGCDLYAHDAALEMSSRLLLHATWLKVRHPMTNEWIEMDNSPEF